MGQLMRRAWYAIRHRRRGDELREEMAFHRDMKRRELEANGLDPVDVDAAAQRAFGSSALASDRSRDVWVAPALQGMVGDVRLAMRLLWRARLVSTVAVLSLALGIGANTAIFSLVNSLLLCELPVRDPGRLAVLVEPARAGADDFSGVPIHARFALFDQLRQRPALFAGTIAWSSSSFGLGSGGDAQSVAGLWVSGSFFDVLGVPAIVGRTLSDADDASTTGHAAAAPVAVISYKFWQREFGGAADAVGRPVRLDGVPFTIVGVTPREFFGPEIGRTFDIIVPLGSEPLLHGRESWVTQESLASPLTVMVRLSAQQTAEAANDALRGIQPQIQTAIRPDSFPEQFRAQYLKEPLTLAPISAASTNLRRRYSRPLLTLLGVVALVLLIACGNVANLLLARTTARRHELSVRRALGAPRWRLIRQLLAESVLLAAIAAAVGLVLADWGSHALVHYLSTEANPIFLDLSVNVRIVTFTVVVSVLTVLLFGVAPAFRASGIVPADALATRTSIGASGRAGVSSSLVVAQVALSLVLVATSGLLMRTFTTLQSRSLGFDPHNVLVATLSTARSVVAPGQRPSVYERARVTVGELPGIEAAGFAVQTPIVAGPMFGQPIKDVSGGAPLPPRGVTVDLNLVSQDWFTTLETPLIDGRDFGPQDRTGTPAVAIVNQAFARKFLNGASPLGHTAALFLPGPPPPPVEIVGLVADAVYGSLRYPIAPTIYLPISQSSGPVLPFLSTINMAIRTRGEPPARLTRTVAAAIGEINADLSLSFRSLDSQVDQSLMQERALALLSGFFGAVALLLAALGLYGVTTYAVALRRMEIGIRMALGATAGGIVRALLVRVAVLVCLGVVAGAMLTWWATRFVASLLYGLHPRDPATMAGAAAVLAAVATVAAWLPARSAARVDPAIALRYE